MVWAIGVDAIDCRSGCFRENVTMRKNRAIVLGQEMLESREVMSLFGGGSFLSKIGSIAKYTPAGFIASKIPTNRLPGGEYVKTAQGLSNPLGPGGVLGVDKLVSGKTVNGSGSQLSGRGGLVEGEVIAVKQAQGTFVYSDSVDGKEVLKSAKANLKSGGLLGKVEGESSELVLGLRSPEREVMLKFTKQGDDVNKKGVLTRTYKYLAECPGVAAIDGESGLLSVKLNRKSGTVQMQFVMDRAETVTESSKE